LCLLPSVHAAGACGRQDAGLPAEASPHAARLYVTSGLTDQVMRLDPQTGAVVSTFDLDMRRDEVDEPHGVTISPDGRHWYVTLAHGNPTLWKFELPDDRLVGRLRLGSKGAARVGVTPDGRLAFVPDYDRAGAGAVSEVMVVRTEDLHLVGRVDVCPAPHDAEVSPDGSLVGVTCSLSDEIVFLDPGTLDVVHRFFAGPEPGLPGEPRYKPLNLVWSPDGRFVHVTLSAAALIRTFSVEGDTVAEVPVGEGPAQLASADDGRLLVIANRLDRTASVVEVSFSPDGVPRLEERRRLQLDLPYPHGVALTPDGGRAFLTYEGEPGRAAGVVAVSTSDGVVSWVVEVGAYLLGAAYYTPKSGS
jgi:DNA-binding beta-propeller fold protein YncE